MKQTILLLFLVLTTSVTGMQDPEERNALLAARNSATLSSQSSDSLHSLDLDFLIQGNAASTNDLSHLNIQHEDEEKVRPQKNDRIPNCCLRRDTLSTRSRLALYCTALGMMTFMGACVTGYSAYIFTHNNSTCWQGNSTNLTGNFEGPK